MSLYRFFLNVATFIVSTVLVHAQVATYSISGEVLNEDTIQPLPYVNIVIKDEGLGATTDESGSFLFSGLSPGPHTLILSYIGFEDKSIEINLPAPQGLKLSLKPELIEMSTLVVTGTRTERFLKDVPVTTQVIKREKLQEAGGADISQVLGYVTGIAVVENQFGTGIELSGFDANHVLVMVDGLKMIGRTNGQLDISQIPIEQIERIEIVKGAASALYGSEAMGGVVNIITSQADEKLGLKVSSVLGGYGRIGGNASLSGTLRGWKSKVHVNKRIYGGNALNSGSLWENGSAYDKLTYGFQTSGNLQENTTLNFQASKFGEELSTDLGPFEDVSTNERNSGRLELVNKGKRITTTMGLDYSDYDHLYERIVTSSAYVYSADRTTEQLIRGELRGLVEREKHALMVGMGNESERTESDRITGGEQTASLSHLFMQDEWKLSQKISSTVGARWDVHSIYGNYFSPKISFMLKPELISRIRLSFGQGFRAPTFKELFIDYTVQGIGYRIIGDPELLPERSNNFNFDIERWHTQKYHGRLNLFYNRIENLIDYAFVGLDTVNNLQRWQTANIKRAITSGAEVDLTYFFNKRTEWTMGYAFLNTWDVDNESPINLKAKHKANTSLRFKISDAASINVSGQFIGDRYYGEESTTGEIESEEWIDSYTLWNVHLQSNLVFGFEGNVGIKNLTDVYDVIWGPMPGREWYFGINYNHENRKRK